jgi:hypothetical protein
MSDGGDRFDKLRELDEQTQTDDERSGHEDADTESDATATDAADEPRPVAQSTDPDGPRSTDASADELSPADDPPFAFDEAKQRPLYARPSAWDAFEDALALEVERLLREHDVRNAEKRELHDAALRVAARHPEEIADELLAGRGLDRDE